MEYAFLADFDLLRDSRQDVRDRPWTNPACRVVIDHYYKLERTREEIQRLNVEIRRVVTYIWDEDKFLRSKEADIMLENPGLARQVKIHRLERGRFNAQHMDRFRKLASLPGFTGSIIPGASTELERNVHSATNMEVDDTEDDCCQSSIDDTYDTEGYDDDKDVQEEEDIEAMVHALISITVNDV